MHKNFAWNTGKPSGAQIRSKNRNFAHLFQTWSPNQLVTMGSEWAKQSDVELLITVHSATTYTL